MCGIVGTLSNKNRTHDITHKIVEKLSGEIVSRGPDDYAVYVDANVGVAIRRLAIQDLTTGIYPFATEDRNTVLVFNGEIYNYPQLKKELISEGDLFKTTCDAEVILKGFCRYGPGYFRKLQGMFAICIWQKNEKTLYLVRDRVGIKPIYYYQKDDEMYFSSEVKSLLALREFYHKFDIDESAVATLMGFMYLPDSANTIVSQIKKVEAGTYLKFSPRGFEKVKYWDLRTAFDSGFGKNIPSTFDEAQNHLEELLTESVKMHMLSDVPVGVLLSGGVDSGLIAALLTKKLGYTDLRTFTARFNHKFDESSQAKATADYLGTKHTDLFVDTSKVNNDIEKLIHHYDALDTFDGGLITTSLLSAKIRESGMKVVLLGEGSDEIFGGYSWFGLSKFPFNKMPQYVRSSLYYYATTRNVSNRFGKYTGLINDFFSKSNELDIFKQISHLEVTTQLPNHLLMKVDKGSMAHSVEARVPYLDHKVVEYAYNIPSEYKYWGNTVSLKNVNEKYILRKIAEKYLPHDTAWRKKKGFMLPMHDVLYQDINKVKQYVLEGKLAQKLLGNNGEVLFKEAGSSIIDMDREYAMWRLFILEVWYQNIFIK